MDPNEDSCLEYPVPNKYLNKLQRLIFVIVILVKNGICIKNRRFINLD